MQRRIVEEEDRIEHYLHTSTEGQLMDILNLQLIANHISGILYHPSSGLDALLQTDRVSDLLRMYHLFGRITRGTLDRATSGHDDFKKALAEWIVARGKKINEGLDTSPAAQATSGEPAVDADANDKGKGKAVDRSAGAAGPATGTQGALQWVQHVLDLKDKFDRLLNEAFMSDKSFQTKINEVATILFWHAHLNFADKGVHWQAFESFVNSNAKSPEYVSLFLDDNLKKGIKGVSLPLFAMPNCRLTSVCTHRKQRTKSTLSL